MFSLNTKGILLRHGKPHNVKPDKYGYVRIAIRHKGKQHIIGEHRIVWLLVNNGWPSKSIDHIDRNRSNNHPINLRLATREQQLANSAGKNIRKNGITSKGVMRIDGNRKRPFVAKICGKHIGYFATVEEAVKARRLAEDKYFTHHTK